MAAQQHTRLADFAAFLCRARVFDTAHRASPPAHGLAPGLHDRARGRRAAGISREKRRGLEERGVGAGGLGVVRPLLRSLHARFFSRRRCGGGVGSEAALRHVGRGEPAEALTDLFEVGAHQRALAAPRATVPCLSGRERGEEILARLRRTRSRLAAPRVGQMTVTSERFRHQIVMWHVSCYSPRRPTRGGRQSR